MSKRIFPLLILFVALFFMSGKKFNFQTFVDGRINEAGVFFLPTAAAEIVAETTFELIEEPAKKKALRDLEDDELNQLLLNRLMTNPYWKSLVDEKKMSVGLVNMADEDNIRYASVNGRHMMYAASLPKIAVLAAAQDAIEQGELVESDEVKRDMRLMIAKSNNAATTRMIDRIGFERIERTMTDPELKLYDPEFGGGLWVGKRYAAGGRRYPDPMKGISHAATTEQICRYFYLLANDELISPESSAKMRSYLVDPELHHKFVNTLDRVAPMAKVYRKSGSWSTFHADVALVQGPERNYIITALVDDPKGEQICRELAQVLDDILKEKV